jgi:Fe-S cluster assembly ATP-binding protein
MLTIKNLKVNAENKEILKSINLNINDNEIHVLMGKNGTGKSTLASIIMGDPRYGVINGEITFDNQNLLNMKVDERARLGIFLAMQNPKELDGVTNIEFLKNAINSRREEKIKLFDLYKEVEDTTSKLKMKEDYTRSFVNDGFSGGEKKKNEIVQMLLLKPKLVILDEIDSGLDIDAIKIVGKIIKEYQKETQ